MFWEDEAAAQGVKLAGAAPAAGFDAAGFGVRLRQARTHAGLSQDTVAQAVGVSQPTYSRMEKGFVEATRVTSRFLDDLSRLLGRPMGWFLMGSPVRDRVRLAARRTDEQDVRTRAERVLDLLEVDAELDDVEEFTPLGQARSGAPRWKALVETSPGHASKAQGAELAVRLRERLGLGHGPVDDLPDLLEGALGVDVAVLALGGGLSAVVAFDDERDVAVLAVNVEEPWARQRFSFAHELAHLLYQEGHAYDARMGASRSNPELRADKFAQNFLIPAAGVRAWAAQRGYEPDQRLSWEDGCVLADEYGVSPATAWIAMQDIDVAPTREAPSAAGAAVVAHHLQRHRVRDANRRLERVPTRVETRVLEAFRHGFVPESTTARVLGQAAGDATDLGDVVEQSAQRTASGVLALR